MAFIKGLLFVIAALIIGLVAIFLTPVIIAVLTCFIVGALIIALSGSSKNEG